MKRSGMLVIAAVLVTFGCNQDPARSVKIIIRSSEQASAMSTSTQAPDLNWHLPFCPPVTKDSPGPSNLTANGPCGFEQREAVSCESLHDDFNAAFVRKVKDEATLVTFLNVEHYHGPGSYDGAQMFVTVQSGTTIYRWSSDNVHATVGPGEAFVTLPETRLDAEPLLVRCTGLLGPATNYQYQCGGRSDASIAIDRTVEGVSGKLQCAERQKK